jgi:hypothetical protein
MGPLEQILTRLRAGRSPATGPRSPYTAADLARRTVRAGAVELPILNLAGLWALRALAPDDGNEADGLVKILWVLRHQHDDRIADAAVRPPSAEELAAVAREVDLASLPDYVAALEAMLAFVSKKKTPPMAAATAARDSA